MFALTRHFICFVRNNITNIAKKMYARRNFRMNCRLTYYRQNLKQNDFYKFVWMSKVFPSIALISQTIENYVIQSDIEANIAHLITLARIAIEKGDIERAEAILLMGLKISDDHKIYLGIPYIYDILTSIALGQGNILKAEMLLINAVEKMTMNGLPEDNHHIIDFKLRLARIYSNFRDNDWAEIGFKTCLEAQKNKIENGDHSTRTGMLYVNILFWYGVHMIRNHKFSDAKRTLDEGYQYSMKIKGLSPYQEMVILYTLADLNSELGYNEIALQNILNAVVLGKGISSLDLPKCYTKLANIYMKLGVYDLAETTAKHALKLAELFGFSDVVEEANALLILIADKRK